MNDLELTKLCAQAMGLASASYPETGQVVAVESREKQWLYDPLHDDAQAMALVKKFNLSVNWNYAEWMGSPDGVLPVLVAPRSGAPNSASTDLNRAIVECVAKMQKAKP